MKAWKEQTGESVLFLYRHLYCIYIYTIIYWYFLFILQRHGRLRLDHDEADQIPVMDEAWSIPALHEIIRYGLPQHGWGAGGHRLDEPMNLKVVLVCKQQRNCKTPYKR